MLATVRTLPVGFWIALASPTATPSVDFFAVCDDAISCQEYAGVANGNAAIDVCDYDDQTSCLDCDCTAAQGCGLFMDA